jgi:hypothetical protein
MRTPPRLLSCRGIEVDDVTVWAGSCGSRRCRRTVRSSAPVGSRWYIDETDVKVADRGATCSEGLTWPSTCSVRVAGWHGGAPVLRAGDRHDEGDTGGGRDRRGTDLPGGARVEVMASACAKLAECSVASFRMRQWSPVSGRHERTHTSAPIERITLAPTVACDLRKWRSAQRLPTFS